MTRALESVVGAVKSAIGSMRRTASLQGLKMLELDDLPRWKLAVRQAHSSGYGCYFPFVMAHQRPGRTAVLIAEDAGCLCVFIHKDGEHGPHIDLFLPPMPFDVGVARRCLERANDFNGDRSARILRIDADDAPRAASLPGLRVSERRSQYLFAPRAFGDLSGGKYRTLRYHVSKARRLETLEVVPYDESYASGCRKLLQRWTEHHRAEFGTSGDAGISKRALALAGSIPAPDLVGEILLLGGRVVAFALGGELRPGLGCLFEAKTDPDGLSLAHFQFYSFLSKLDAFELVNGGSDARRAGIRQLKESLRPEAMHVEFRGTQVAT